MPTSGHHVTLPPFHPSCGTFASLQKTPKGDQRPEDVESENAGAFPSVQARLQIPLQDSQNAWGTYSNPVSGRSLPEVFLILCHVAFRHGAISPVSSHHGLISQHYEQWVFLQRLDKRHIRMPHPCPCHGQSRYMRLGDPIRSRWRRFLTSVRGLQTLLSE